MVVVARIQQPAAVFNINGANRFEKKKKKNQTKSITQLVEIRIFFQFLFSLRLVLLLYFGKGDRMCVRVNLHRHCINPVRKEKTQGDFVDTFWI